jgi:glycosyltransferase involved in cell wall biosynthesis
LLVTWKNGSMLNRPLRILQVSTADIGGGAEKIAWDLLQNYRARGESSWLAVGYKRGRDPDVIAIPKLEPDSWWSRFWLNLAKRLKADQGKGNRLSSRARTALRTLARPRHELGVRFGVEDFDYPGTKRLLQLAPNKPDVVHCHNLHGGYFDLRFLPWLSYRVPVILTLHDAWLLSGHCAHSFQCDRWKTGCGHCPDLTIYPAIARDATARNWRRKRDIFSRSRFYVSTPSKWLMRKVEQSLLNHSVAEARIIPNGVDLSVFCPADRRSVRAVLNLPQDASILLFAGNRAQTNMWKDYTTLRIATTRIAGNLSSRLLLLCLGGEVGVERMGEAEIRSIPYEKNPEVVAQYYQAADLYVHSSRIDTFPCSVLEALACATPVVATEVGGIPEQIRGWHGLSLHSSDSNRHATSHATGVLVPPGDAGAMAESVRRLLSDDPLRWQMSKNASKDARERFNIEQQAERYLEWYAQMAGNVIAHDSRSTVAL